jgi:hypothetical protein
MIDLKGLKPGLISTLETPLQGYGCVIPSIASVPLLYALPKAPSDVCSDFVLRTSFLLSSFFLFLAVMLLLYRACSFYCHPALVCLR